MRVVFLYNDAADDPTLAAEEADPTRSPIVTALARLRHEVVPMACTLDLAEARRKLLVIEPDVVLNRVESLGGSDAMMGAVPLLLETMQIPYTGCTGEALAGTSSKLTVKERLVRAGLPTPAWITADGNHSSGSVLPAPGQFILKSVLEHGSFQMSDAAVIESASEERVAEAISERESATGRPFFAEQFIEGREFNLSVWGNEPTVLPLAEIDFSDFPAGKPHVVAHRAKWDASAFEYHHTPRRFEFPPADATLLKRLCELTIECAWLFNLQGGYSRVDFRCDRDGQPWILEINTNPCLSPDAGFIAAVEQSGIEFEGALQKLLDDALTRAARCRVSGVGCQKVGELAEAAGPNVAGRR